MSSQKTAPQELSPLYQCDSKVHQTLKAVHDHLHRLCCDHTHRLVKMETMEGDVFEGHIVHCHKGVVYICLNDEGSHRAFFPGAPFPYPYYNRFVLPLVLFNLLTISLL
ncbi:hypothetical protein SAMN02799624_05756 [Paenibacillus sp. UNC496MF]|uniref:hypothetical protein n=1 Tax=Paenibacillus sp. UNC496MF TaxID=1502753 RepID=UPI0008F1ACE7|nr:hypothetical protein [Paenibacillus sp. UNC496MF]SFJ73884.1 hypothetical protein SAMN02799624_05756 [Paenibacillus sp. UNC496MF]